MMEYLGFYHYEQYSLIISSHVPLYFLSASACLSPLPPSWLGWVAFELPFSLLACIVCCSGDSLSLCDPLLCAPEYKYKNDCISCLVQDVVRLGDQQLQIITMAKLLRSLEMMYLCCVARMPRVALFLSRKKPVSSLGEEFNKPCSSGDRLIN